MPARLRTDAPPDWLEVRGEVFLRLADFERINDELGAAGKPLFANPRNADRRACCARRIRRSPPRARSASTSTAWSAIDGPRASTATARRSPTCASSACATHPEAKRCATLDEVRAYIADMAARRHALEHEIDGAVIKVDRYADAQRARRHLEVPALGHRLQVPRRGADDPAARHPGQRRAAPAR